MVRAFGAHEYQVHAVFSGISECYRLVMTALAAVQIFSAGQRGVLDALLVHMEHAFLQLALLAPIHTIIRLVALFSTLEVAADTAVVNQAAHSILH